jgi:SHS family lactate transporter-like MFS transporter
MMLATVREQAGGLTKGQRNSFVAAFMGWSMDAFDYFIIVFVYAEIGREFHVSLTQMAFLTTVTLVGRPIGAFVFGRWADKVGRRIPLITDVVYYSLIGFACAFVHNYEVLLVLRALYGIGMGGEWGLGAALAMEKVPAHKRGFFSGLLQQGYATGYLCAAIAYLLIDPIWGWRGLFIFSIVPAMTVLFFQLRIEESEVWKATKEKVAITQTTVREIISNPVIIRRFVYLVVLMSAFNWMAHGTQDIFPTFLKSTSHGGLHFTSHQAIFVAVVYNIGAIIGGTLIGSYSQKFGRRRAIIFAVALGLPVVPLFAYSTTLATICLGSFIMQFFIQGAWGVIPAHLSEMSPDEIRGFYPGVTYQLGNLIASLNLPIQERLAARHGYPFALAATIVPVLLTVILVTALGKENKGIAFGGGSADQPQAEPARGAPAVPILGPPVVDGPY